LWLVVFLPYMTTARAGTAGVPGGNTSSLDPGVRAGTSINLAHDTPQSSYSFPASRRSKIGVGITPASLAATFPLVYGTAQHLRA
jgi:hypothetical protein